MIIYHWRKKYSEAPRKFTWTRSSLWQMYWLQESIRATYSRLSESGHIVFWNIYRTLNKKENPMRWCFNVHWRCPETALWTMQWRNHHS